MAYGQDWRRYRRLFWQHFHPGVVSKYYGVQRDESRQFLSKLLSCPERLEEHIRQYVSVGRHKNFTFLILTLLFSLKQARLLLAC